jgi:hypothetical protein
MRRDELGHLRHIVTALEHRYRTSEHRPQPKPLTILHWVWSKVSPDERIRFLVERLTPNERRALHWGFEAEDAHDAGG